VVGKESLKIKMLEQILAERPAPPVAARFGALAVIRRDPTNAD
jgi:hypothetical protein